MVGGAGGFRDEDIDYAVRLQQAGVPTELHVFPGAPHGFGLFVGSSIAQQAETAQRNWLARQWGSVVRGATSASLLAAQKPSGQAS